MKTQIKTNLKIENSKGARKKFFGFGFTLVELIVVIIILAILTTIAFLSFSSQSSSARDSQRLSDLGNISKGLSIYYVKSGVFPDPDDVITIFSGSTSTGTAVSYQGDTGLIISRLVNGNVQLFTDPNDKIPYTYTISKDKHKHKLLAFLENNSLVSYNANITDLSLSAFDYTNRFPYLRGDTIGIILSQSGSTITPFQDYYTGAASYSITNQVNTGLILVTRNSSDTDLSLVSTGLSIGAINYIESVASNTGNISNYSQPNPPLVTADDSSNTIIGLDVAIMEYSSDTGVTRSQSSNPIFTGNSTVLVRIKASGSIPESNPTTLTFTTSLSCGPSNIYNYLCDYQTGSGFTYGGLNFYVQYVTGTGYVAYTSQTESGITASDHIGVFALNNSKRYILKSVNEGANTVWNPRKAGYTSYSGTTYTGTVAINLTGSYVADKNMLGEYYQWGRNDPVGLSSTTPITYDGLNIIGGINLSGTGFITVLSSPLTWVTPSYHNTSSGVLWANGTSGFTGPCPDGYYLPTISISYEMKYIMEIVTNNDDTKGLLFSRWLKLPMAGMRDADGKYKDLGLTGYYWSNRPAVVLTECGNTTRITTSRIYPGNSGLAISARVFGESVRCLKN